jgi:hypothetical protein
MPVSSLVRFVIDAEQFQLGWVFAPVSGVRVEVVTLVPADTGFAPYLRVSGDDETLAEVTDRLTVDDRVSDFVRLSERGRQRLYRVEWAMDLDGLFGCVSTHDVAVYRVVGTDERWEFSVFSSSDESLRAFHRALAAHDVPITVRRTDTRVAPLLDTTVDLSPKQREGLQVAYENGYFEVPQRTTLGALAAEIGVSRQAVSNWLTRAFAALVQAMVVDTDDE